MSKCQFGWFFCGQSFALTLYTILPKPFTSGITEKHHTYLLPKPTTQEQTYTTTVIPVASKPPTPQTTSITVPVYSKTSLYRKKAQASSGSYTPKYKARKAPNKCSKCGQPKLLDTGYTINDYNIYLSIAVL